MSFIQEKIIHIDLGISKRYTLIQFSDVHVSAYGQSDDRETIDKAVTQEKIWLKQRLDFAHYFNESVDSEQMLPSAECLSQLIDYANKNHPDLVLLTGDIIDYHSRANYAFLTESVKRLERPYLFSCGNHEYPSALFQDLSQDKNGLSYVDLGEFLVFSINDSARKIDRNQLEAFEKLLEHKKPIILAMHIPMMTMFNEPEFMKLDSYYSMKYNDCDEVTASFIKLICSCNEVKAVFCGHTHGQISSLIALDKPQYCCSSGLIGSVNKIIIE